MKGRVKTFHRNTSFLQSLSKFLLRVIECFVGSHRLISLLVHCDFCNKTWPKYKSYILGTLLLQEDRTLPELLNINLAGWPMTGHQLLLLSWRQLNHINHFLTGKNNKDLRLQTGFHNKYRSWRCRSEFSKENSRQNSPAGQPATSILSRSGIVLSSCRISENYFHGKHKIFWRLFSFENSDQHPQDLYLLLNPLLFLPVKK